MTFEEIFLGPIPAYPEFAALLAAYMLGGFLFKRQKAKLAAEANKEKLARPDYFSWDYFFTAKENVQEFFAALVVGWAFIRFVSPELDTVSLMGVCFGTGLLGQAFVLDLIFEFFRAGDALKTYRKKNGHGTP